jgi:HPt (histidine-containing phosphotransfer) domain-containing protein
MNSALNRLIRDKQSADVIEAARKKEKVKVKGSTQIPHPHNDIIDIYGESAAEAMKLGLNIAEALELYGDEWDMYSLALESFSKNIPAVIEILRGIIETLRSVTEEKLSEYAVNVHGLKGISGSIGADAIRIDAEALEQMAKSGDIAGVLSQNDDLLNNAEMLMNNLQGWLAKQ